MKLLPHAPEAVFFILLYLAFGQVSHVTFAFDSRVISCLLKKVI